MWCPHTVRARLDITVCSKRVAGLLHLTSCVVMAICLQEMFEERWQAVVIPRLRDDAAAVAAEAAARRQERRAAKAARRAETHAAHAARLRTALQV